ncbi:MAG TPA: Na+/H+ antiporter NhaA, partial [Pseudomonadales bacterium]|nr:Na+/H+ antiporter NhaA [Pseudomonadales bacterium]
MPTHQPPQTNHNRTAPWERFFARVLSPLEQFIEQQSTSSFLLLACTLLALGLANSSVSDAFLQWLHTPIAISVGTARFELGLQHWINEALMSFFFLLVGLELKREL